MLAATREIRGLTAAARAGMLRGVTTLLVNTSEGVTLRQDVAGVGSRFAAGLLDGLVIIAGYLLIGFLVLLAVRVDPTGMSSFVAGLGIGGTLLAILLYHVLFHALREGQTLGKIVLGIRVMSADGYPPTFLQVLLRALVWPIDGFFCVPVPIGLIVIAVTPKHQRLGDLVAGTLVIRSPKARLRTQPWPRETWSGLEARTLPLGPGLAARLSPADLEFLRELLTRTELLPDERRKLFIEAARHYCARLSLGEFEDARVVLKELYLFAREMIAAKAA